PVLDRLLLLLSRGSHLLGEGAVRDLEARDGAKAKAEDRHQEYRREDPHEEPCTFISYATARGAPRGGHGEGRTVVEKLIFLEHVPRISPLVAILPPKQLRVDATLQLSEIRVISRNRLGRSRDVDDRIRVLGLDVHERIAQ